MYLCLGDAISFPELYKKAPEYTFIEPTIAMRTLLSAKTLEIVHWMVQQYFSSYKAVVQLYLTSDVTNVFSRKPKKTSLEDTEQICIIYPDLWSMTQSAWKLLISPTPDTAILHGGLTQLQKAKIFRWVKYGSIKTLLSTNRWLFFDRHNLKEIIIHDPTSRAYSSQSEPRFVLEETATHISSSYDSKITYTTT